MSFEHGFNFVQIDPPTTEWIMKHGIIPDSVAVWPAKLFREAHDADGATTEMSLDDQVLLVIGKYVANAAGEIELSNVAALLPVSVAEGLARLILGLHGNDKGGGDGT